MMGLLAGNARNFLPMIQLLRMRLGTHAASSQQRMMANTHASKGELGVNLGEMDGIMDPAWSGSRSGLLALPHL